MEKSYSLSEVIENMDFGEVAVKIDGFEHNTGEQYKHTPIGITLYFDENDNGILKYGNGRRVIIANVGGAKKDKFVIMSKEAYNKIVNK